MNTILELLEAYAKKGVLDLGHVLGILHSNACEAEVRIASLEAKIAALEHHAPKEQTKHTKG